MSVKWTDSVMPRDDDFNVAEMVAMMVIAIILFACLLYVGANIH